MIRIFNMGMRHPLTQLIPKWETISFVCMRANPSTTGPFFAPHRGPCMHPSQKKLAHSISKQRNLRRNIASIPFSTRQVMRKIPWRQYVCIRQFHLRLCHVLISLRYKEKIREIRQNREAYSRAS